MARVSPSIFSRIILVVVVLASLGGGLWVVSQLLEPVAVPPPPLHKAAITFNPASDVSKNLVFQGLQPLGPMTVEPGEMGRLNPFLPVTVPNPASSTPSFVATSTTATSSQP